MLSQKPHRLCLLTKTIQGGSRTSPENVRLWVRTPGRRLVIAEEIGKILGVEAGTAAGQACGRLRKSTHISKRGT